MTPKQLMMFYGPQSPLNDSKSLEFFLSLSEDDMHRFLFNDIRKLANKHSSLKIRQKRQVTVLNPTAFGANTGRATAGRLTVLSPSAFGFSALVASALTLTALSPSAITLSLLSASTLGATLLSPSALGVVLLGPSALTVSILSPTQVVCQRLIFRLLFAMLYSFHRAMAEGRSIRPVKVTW
ncbi:unnamed protein product [Onchocerca ochengi]|uniref:Uncharacterized protein n=1 Tax=Onchocerca ochengi TaxID=42157 RepID=A0A182EVX6_ONCOC|nr:unnamed protein product [Onchocerca ochengi]